MPPEPSSETIWSGPSRTPGARDMVVMLAGIIRARRARQGSPCSNDPNGNDPNASQSPVAPQGHPAPSASSAVPMARSQGYSGM